MLAGQSTSFTEVPIQSFRPARQKCALACAPFLPPQPCKLQSGGLITAPSPWHSPGSPWGSPDLRLTGPLALPLKAQAAPHCLRPCCSDKERHSPLMALPGSEGETAARTSSCPVITASDSFPGELVLQKTQDSSHLPAWSRHQGIPGSSDLPRR